MLTLLQRLMGHGPNGGFNDEDAQNARIALDYFFPALFDHLSGDGLTLNELITACGSAEFGNGGALSSEALTELDELIARVPSAGVLNVNLHVRMQFIHHFEALVRCGADGAKVSKYDTPAKIRARVGLPNPA